jgi:hypothetical protein
MKNRVITTASSKTFRAFLSTSKRIYKFVCLISQKKILHLAGNCDASICMSTLIADTSSDDKYTFPRMGKEIDNRDLLPQMPFAHAILLCNN